VRHPIDGGVGPFVALVGEAKDVFERRGLLRLTRMIRRLISRAVSLVATWKFATSIVRIAESVEDVRGANYTIDVSPAPSARRASGRFCLGI
jgi:hypothetical protein